MGLGIGKAKHIACNEDRLELPKWLVRRLTGVFSRVFNLGSMPRLVCEMANDFCENPMVVYQVKNISLNKIYFGIFVNYEHYVELKPLEYLYFSKHKLLQQFKRYGVNEFEYKQLGRFKTLDESLEYRDFKISLHMNNGYECYNELFNETYFRCVPLYLKKSHFKTLLKMCLKRNINMSELIGKILDVKKKAQNGFD